MAEPLFLGTDSVLEYHAQQLALFGGQTGIRDEGLLESALAQPQNLYLYEDAADVFDIAAGYAFYLTKNHPFVDGNKRTALQAALGFLRLNGLSVLVPGEANILYSLMMALTEGMLERSDFAEFLSLCSFKGWVTDETLQPTEDERARMHAVVEKGITPDEAKAIIVDFLTSKMRCVLIERCERYSVNPRRLVGLPESLEEEFFPLVRDDLRRAFGME